MYKIYAGTATYKAYVANEAAQIWNITPHKNIIKEIENGKIVRLKIANEFLSVGGAFCEKTIQAIKEHRSMLLVKLK